MLNASRDLAPRNLAQKILCILCSLLMTIPLMPFSAFAEEPASASPTDTQAEASVPQTDAIVSELPAVIASESQTYGSPGENTGDTATDATTDDAAADAAATAPDAAADGAAADATADDTATPEAPATAATPTVPTPTVIAASAPTWDGNAVFANGTDLYISGTESGGTFISTGNFHGLDGSADLGFEANGSDLSLIDVYCGGQGTEVSANPTIHMQGGSLHALYLSGSTAEGSQEIAAGISAADAAAAMAAAGLTSGKVDGNVTLQVSGGNITVITSAAADLVTGTASVRLSGAPIIGSIALEYLTDSHVIIADVLSGTPASIGLHFDDATAGQAVAIYDTNAYPAASASAPVADAGIFSASCGASLGVEGTAIVTVDPAAAAAAAAAAATAAASQAASTSSSTPDASTTASEAIPAPTDLFATVKSNVISLMWDYPEGSVADNIAGFNVYRDGTLVATPTDVTTDSRSYIDTTATVGTTYTYAVAAVYNDVIGPQLACTIDTASLLESGIAGTCQWTVSTGGELVIRPIDNTSGTLTWTNTAFSPWDDLADKIVTAKIEGDVKMNGSFGLFHGCSKLQSIEGLGNLDTSATTSLAGMFQGCSSLTALDLTGLETTAASDLSRMFAGCKALVSLDLTGVDTSHASAMVGMFDGCDSLATVKLGSGFSFRGNGSTTLCVLPTPEAEGTTGLWVSTDGTAYTSSQIASQRNGIADTYTAQAGQRASVPIVEGTSGSCSWYITSAGELIIEPTDGLVGELAPIAYSLRSNTTNAPWKCYTASIRTATVMKGVVLGNGGQVFAGLANLTSIDLSGLDTSGTTDFSSLFEQCSSLTALDISGFDTSSAVQMARMFAGCSALASITGLSAMSTASVKDMSYLFFGCSSLAAIDCGTWDLSSLTDGDLMFAGCSSLAALDLSAFGKTSLTTTDGMFYGCSSLRALDLSGFDTHAVKDMGSMFRECTSLVSLELSGLDTSHLTSASFMFRDCTSLVSLDLSGFDTSALSYAFELFSGCSSLEYLDFSTFDLTNTGTHLCVADGSFDDCTSLAHLILGPNFRSDDIAIPQASSVSPYSGLWVRVGSDGQPASGDDAFSGTAAELGALYASTAKTSPTQIWTYVWQSSTPKLTFLANHATSGTVPDAINATSATADVKLPQNTGALARDGYVFLGWNTLASPTEAAPGTSYKVGWVYAFSGCDAVLYAQWGLLPGAPQSLVPTVLASDSVTLSWAAANPAGVAATGSSTESGSSAGSVPSITNYQVYRTDASSPTPVLVATLGPTARSYTDSGLIANTKYTYTVVASNLYGSGPEASCTAVPGSYRGYGISGTCSWRITQDGELIIEPLDGTSGILADITGASPEWSTLCNQILSVTILPGVATNVAAPLFAGCANLTHIDGLANLDTSRATDMSRMFFGCSSLASLDLSGFDTTKVTSMAYLFGDCRSLSTVVGIEGLDTLKVTDMTALFEGCTSLTSLDLSGFDTSQAAKMADMLGGDLALSTVKVGSAFSFMGSGTTVAFTLPVPSGSDVTGLWTLDGGTTAYTGQKIAEQFNGEAHTYTAEKGTRGSFNIAEGTCGSCSWRITSSYELIIAPIKSTTYWYSEDLADIASPSDAPWWPYRLSVLSATIEPGVETRDSAALFGGMRYLESVDLGGLSVGYTTQSLDSLFYDCASLKSVDLSNLDLRDIRNLSNLFHGCTSLTTVTLPKTSLTSLEDASGMFAGCSSLTSLDVSSFTILSIIRPSEVKVDHLLDGCTSLSTLVIGASLRLDNIVIPEVSTTSPYDGTWVRLDGTGAAASGTDAFTGTSAQLAALYTSTNATLPTTTWTYAWKSSRPRIAFDANGATAGDVPATMVAGAGTGTVTLPANTGALERAGYVFQGWNTVANPTTNNPGVTYAADGTTTFEAHGTDTVLFAQWGYLPAAPASLSVGLTANSVTITWSAPSVPAQSSTSIGSKVISYNVYRDGSSTPQVITGTSFTDSGLLASETHTYTITAVNSNGEGPGITCALAPLACKVSGVSGSCLWYITDANKLVIQPLDGTKGTLDDISLSLTSGWYDYRTSITSAAIAPGVATGQLATLFEGETNLAYIDGLANLDTSKAENMSWMFESCSSLTSLDLSSFDTSNLRDASYMFVDCTNLVSADLTWTSTPRLEDTSIMFYNCTNLASVDLKGIDTSSVTSMMGMFGRCSSLTSLDLSGFDTSNVLWLDGMFTSCSSLQTLDISGFTTAKATQIESMFEGCEDLTSLDVSRFDTSAAENLSSMFRNCASITSLDLSGFVTSSSTIMSDMFEGCYSLQSVKVGASFDFTGKEGTDSARLSTPGFDGATGKWLVDDGTEAYTGTQIAAQFNNAKHTFTAQTGTRTPFDIASGTCGTCSWRITSDYELVIEPTDGTSGKLDDIRLQEAPWYNYRSWITSATIKPGVIAGALAGLFYRCDMLESIDFSGLDTSATTSIANLVRSCPSLVSLDLSGLDTSSVSAEFLMFEGCRELAQLTLSGTFRFTANAQSISLPAVPSAAPYTGRWVRVGANGRTVTGTDAWAGTSDELVALYNSASATAPHDTWTYAWESTTPFVTFEANGATGGDTPEPITLMSATSTLVVPGNTGKLTREGYAFLGWNLITSPTVSAPGTAYPAGSLLSATGHDVTLYAQWGILPSAPRSLLPTLGSGTVKLYWWAPQVDEQQVGSAITGYNVICDGNLIASLPAYTNTYTVTGLTDGTAYTFEVKATNANGEGAKATCIATPGDCLASGIDGSCIWRVTKEGELIIEPADGVSGILDGDSYSFPGWYNESASITTATIKPGVATGESTMLFSGCSSLTKIDGLANLDTSGAKDMSAMFVNCSSLASLDLSGFDTSNVTSMGWMFEGCSSLTTLDLSGFDTSKVVGMSLMFGDCSKLVTIDGLADFDTSTAEEFTKMFWNCSALKSLDLSGFDTSKASDMEGMFDGCDALTLLSLGDKFSVYGNGTTALAMLPTPFTEGTTGLWLSSSNSKIYTATQLATDRKNVKDTYTAQEGDRASFNIAEGTCGTCIWHITSEGGLVIEPADGKAGTLDSISQSANMSDNNAPWYLYCYAIRNAWVKAGVTAGDHAALFSGCKAMTWADLSGLDTSKTTDLGLLFNGCSKLTKVNLSGLDTSNVTSLSCMFRNCTSLESFSASGLETSKVQYAHYLFAGCSNLTSVDLSDFDASSLVGAYEMFYRCTSLTSLDLSNLATPKLKEMGHMFAGCTSLTSLDLSGLDTSNATMMDYMFYDCSNLQELALGPAFSFDGNGKMDVYNKATLPGVSTTAPYDGTWVRTYAGGTIATGADAWTGTSGDLVAAYSTTATTHPTTAATYTWKSTTPRVSFVSNGANYGSAPEAILAASADATVTLPRNTGYLARDGYAFIGWCTVPSPTAANPGTSYAADGTATITVDGHDIVLYAAWGLRPSEVQSLAASHEDGKVTLTWDAPANADKAGITGYIISNAIAGEYVTIGADARSWTDTAVTNGQFYTYVIMATNAYGKGTFEFCSVTVGSLLASGTCGTCTWQLSNLGTLTIMPTNGESGTLDSIGTWEAPWYPYRASIKHAEVADGVTTGEKAALFYGCSAMMDVDFDYVDTSKTKSFADMFANCSSLYMLDLGGIDTSSAVSEAGMFAGCTSMKTVITDKSFSFKDAAGNVLTTLPIPIGDGATGRWYSMEDEEAFTSAQIASDRNNMENYYAAEISLFPDARITMTGTVKNTSAASPSTPDITVTVDKSVLMEGYSYEVLYDGSTTVPTETGVYAVSIRGKGFIAGEKDAGVFTVYNVTDSITADTSYRVRSSASTTENPYILDVASNVPKIGANVSIWTNNGGANQCFTFELGADGYYTIRNLANTSLVLDAAGAVPSVGSNVSTWSTNGGKNQKWVIIPSGLIPDSASSTAESAEAASTGSTAGAAEAASTGNTSFEIALAYDTSLVLDAAGAVPSIGANVSAWTSNGGKNQQWYLEDGGVDITNATVTTSGMARNIGSGTGTGVAPTITVWQNGRDLIAGTEYTISYEGTTTDGTAFGPTSTVPSQAGTYKVTIYGSGTPASGFYGARELGTFSLYDVSSVLKAGVAYRLHSAVDDTFVLDVAGVSPVVGSNVSVWTDNGGKNQCFTFELETDGYYVIRNVANTSLVLDAAGAVPRIGSNVSTWTENGGMNQKWTIAPNSDGSYTVASAYDPTFVLDAAGAVPVIGANVSVWTTNGGSNQKWTVQEVK